MIHVPFSPPSSDEPTHAAWVAWRERCADARDQLIATVAAGESAVINDTLYKAEVLLNIYKTLDGPFFGKCAYCETPVVGNQHGDIEHWRPKKAVSDVHGNRVTIDVNGSQQPHPGYYWLAYDWKNLLLSCITCNQPSRSRSTGQVFGKGTRFPVAGSHATTPGEEQHEEPLLLNPIWDDHDPSDHMDVDECGVMIPKSDCGQTCIDVYGLNRDELIIARRRTALHVRCVLHVLWRYPTGGGCGSPSSADLLQLIREIERGQAPYAVVGRAELRRFKEALNDDA